MEPWPSPKRLISPDLVALSVAWAFSMKILAAALALGCAAASPAFTWSGSTRTGDYRVIATLDGNSRLRSVSLVPQAGIAFRPMQLHAWFIDGEGAILAFAPLATTNARGAALVALGRGAAVPAKGAALVAQIALP